MIVISPSALAFEVGLMAIGVTPTASARGGLAGATLVHLPRARRARYRQREGFVNHFGLAVASHHIFYCRTPVTFQFAAQCGVVPE